MSRAAGLDIRVPIGGLFVVLGLLLTGYGVATADQAGLYERSLMVNVNLWWGLVMLAFGLLLLAGAARGWGRGSARPAAEAPGGRETEARERGLGLEEPGG
jgi:hypothetical protein